MSARDLVARPWAVITAAGIFAASGGVAAGMALAGPAAASPGGGTIVAARTCRAALSRGYAVVTRTTGVTGGHRYWTSVALATTGDPYRLVVDRLVGPNRVARGIGGDVTTARSWGASSRTARLTAHVAGVDTRTGAIIRITC